MRCPQCGTNVPVGSLFCANCGMAFGQQSYAAATQSSPYLSPTPYKPYDDGQGQGTAALVCGICAFVVPFVGFILAIIAVALGAAAKRSGSTSGQATAGLVLGIVGLASQVIGTIYFFFVLGAIL